MNKPFNVGGKVFDIRKGNGVVSRSSLDKPYSLKGILASGEDISYTEEGKYYVEDLVKSLYHGHDLIVTVKEPEYECQVLFFYPKTNTWHISAQFYSSIDHFLRETGILYYTNVELFEPSKRIRSI